MSRWQWNMPPSPGSDACPRRSQGAICTAHLQQQLGGGRRGVLRGVRVHGLRPVIVACVVPVIRRKEGQDSTAARYHLFSSSCGSGCDACDEE